MNVYSQQHAFYCGIDLHARTMYICILDATGTKSKNDRNDSLKIAQLLRGGNYPLAYVYPAGMRATCDLMRSRNFFVRKRAQLVAHIQNTTSQ